jgi:hypothetical protein
MSPLDSAGYVRQLDRELRRRFARDDDFLEEVRAHLEDASDRGQRTGLPRDEAEALAVQQFGPPALVAAAHAANRYRLMHRGLSIAAVTLGVAIAWVDARPTWDDTGITAGMMLLCATLLGMLGPRRPWLWALLTGIWIPAYAMIRAPGVGKLAMLLVLIFPLAGAYLGRAVRRWSTP